MLKVANLCKRFDEFCLDNVSFEVPEGMIVGFIGQNGAGKTTTLKCIMRTVQPDSGKVVVFGRDMAETEKESKQLISFTTGAFDYYPNDTLKKLPTCTRPFTTSGARRILTTTAAASTLY